MVRRAYRSSVLPFLFLFLLFFLPFVSALRAQELGAWENLTNLPGRSLRDFWPGDSVMGVRDVRGRLLLSRDGGSVWEPKGFLAEGLHFGSGGSVAALSDKREIFHSSDNGRTFVQVADGLIPQTGFAVLMGAGEYVYVVNYGDSDARYFLSQDGGETWEEVQGLSGQSWRFAVGPEGDLYILAAPQNKEVKRYSVRDNAWSSALTFPQVLVSISFGRDGRFYAVSATDSLYRSGIGDLNLEPFASAHQFPANFAVNSHGELYVPYPPGTGDQFARFSVDGREYEEIPTNLIYPDLPPRFVFDPDDNLWVIYGDYGAYHFDSSGSGYVWNPVVFPGYGNVDQLDVLPGGNWLVGANRRAYLSEDEGSTFAPINVPDEVVSIYDYLLPADSSVLFLSRPGETFRSENLGATWTVSSRRVGYFHRVENGTLFTVGSFTPQKSTDRGETWTNVNGIRLPLMYISSNGSRVYGVTSQTVHFSSDWGEMWDTAAIPNLHVPASTVTADGTLIGGTGLVDTGSATAPVYLTYRAGDGDRVLHPLPCDDPNTTYRFAHDPLGRPWLAMACGLFRSDDEGATWKKIADIPEGRNPTALVITESGTFILGTDEGLFKAQRISSAGFSAAESRTQVILRTLPNPVAERGVLRFVLAGASHVRIGLYDGSGREAGKIAEGNYEAGEHAISWDLPEGLAAGRYLLTIETEKGSAAQTVIVIPE